MREPLYIVSADPLFRTALREALEPDGRWDVQEAESEDFLPEGAYALADAKTPISRPARLLRLGTGGMALPVRLSALKARLASLPPQAADVPDTIALGAGCLFSPRERRVTCMRGMQGGEAQLTEKETALLAALAAAGASGMRREALLQKVWNYSEEADTHTLETHLYRLRAKLRELTEEEVIATTEEGYALAYG